VDALKGWINGRYFEWNSKKQELIREYEESVLQSVVLKRLENVENANKRWLEEVCYLSI